jgi:hypothetical protein
VTQTEPITYFIDRALGGKFVPKALRQVGAKVEVHGDHFAPDAADVDWLPDVTQRGWVVLTRDANIGRNLVEQVAIAESGARVFVLAIDEATGTEMAEALIAALPRMEKLIQSHNPPFIAKVYSFGRVQIWQNAKKLSATLRQIPPASK